MNEEFGTALAGVFRHLLPEMVLVLAACIVFLGGTFRANRHLWGWVSLAGLAGAMLTLGLTSRWPAPTDIAAFATPVSFDTLAHLIRFIGLAGGIVLLLLAWNEVADRQAADHHACLLIIIAGVGLVACANDLVTLFLALELISIPTYVLLYLPRHDEAAQEAALKYFLLSVFSSALLLFGFSYLYGLTGTTNIAAILDTLHHTAGSEMPVIAQVALIMVVAGLGFRITAAPFHFYAPDVYQGAPTVGAALLAFVPKVAGFVALIRVLGFVMPAGVPASVGGHPGMGLGDQVPLLFWFLAIFTMFVGNLLALRQDNLKRLLAYSSVAHAGYMLVALATAPYLHRNRETGPDGVEALLYYLVAYGAMTVGAFAVIAFLSTPERPVETVDDIAGLSRSHPVTALAMTVFLFSLIGIPLTAGFTGKFLVFFGSLAVETQPATTLYVILALVGMVNAAIGGWYYLRLIAAMYLRNPLRPIETPATIPGLTTLAICAVLTIGLSVPPGASWLLELTHAASGQNAAGEGLAEKK